MTKASTLVLLVMLLGLYPLSAHAFGVCQGPPNTFISVVGEKQKTSLTVVPRPQDELPCTSQVAQAVREEASWQLLVVKDCVQIELDNSGIIVGLRKLPCTVVPYNVKGAAMKQGLDVQ